MKIINNDKSDDKHGKLQKSQHFHGTYGDKTKIKSKSNEISRMTSSTSTRDWI